MNSAKTEDECPLFIQVGWVHFTVLSKSYLTWLLTIKKRAGCLMLVKHALHCWSHFNWTCLYCREWNQHVLSVKWRYCIEKNHPMLQIYQISPPNQHHCIHHALLHQISQIAFFCHLLLVEIAYLAMLFMFLLMDRAPDKNKLHSLVR